MKVVQIIHNPTAGNGRHGKQELLELAKNLGEVIHYASTDEEGWEDFYRNKIDLILVAGGDGTIHKVSRVLLNQKLAQPGTPFKLLPLGTANNIAKTLEVPVKKPTEVKRLRKKALPFDAGKIKGIPSHKFFLESVGTGIFPELIAEMDKRTFEDTNSSEKLKITREILLKIAKNYKPQKAKININGIKIKGEFLLIELMNIRFIGPNFRVAPQANPGDGFFDLVLIPGEKRSQLISYLEKLIDDKAEDSTLAEFTTSIRLQKMKLQWEGSKIHVDDNLLDYGGNKLKMKVIPEAFNVVKTK